MEQFYHTIALKPLLSPSRFISPPGHASGALGWGRKHLVKWTTKAVKGVPAGLLL